MTQQLSKVTGCDLIHNERAICVLSSIVLNIVCVQYPDDVSTFKPPGNVDFIANHLQCFFRNAAEAAHCFARKSLAMLVFYDINTALSSRADALSWDIWVLLQSSDGMGLHGAPTILLAFKCVGDCEIRLRARWVPCFIKFPASIRRQDSSCRQEASKDVTGQNIIEIRILQVALHCVMCSQGN